MKFKIWYRCRLCMERFSHEDSYDGDMTLERVLLCRCQVTTQHFCKPDHVGMAELDGVEEIKA